LPNGELECAFQVSVDEEKRKIPTLRKKWREVVATVVAVRDCLWMMMIASVQREEEQREKIEFSTAFDVCQSNEGKHCREAPRSEEGLHRMLKTLDETDPNDLPEIPRLTAPGVFPPSASAQYRLNAIQRYISSLQYNYTGENYFHIRKDRGAKRMAETAREIIRESLPIKCIEAVFLGFYFTLQMTDLLRIPIRFQSCLEQNGRFEFKHIVLAIRGPNMKWGCIGLSRKNSLMSRKLRFDSLSSMLKDFQDSYEELGHEVQHVGIGLPFGHDEFSTKPIHWRPLFIKFDGESRVWNEGIEDVIDQFVERIDIISSFVQTNKGQLPPWFTSKFKIFKPRKPIERSLKAEPLNPEDPAIADLGNVVIPTVDMKSLAIF